MALREILLNQELFEQFCGEFTGEMNGLRKQISRYRDQGSGSRVPRAVSENCVGSARAVDQH
jgi:hypothetical protein